MPKPIQILEMVSLSDTGLQRDHNEDAVLADIEAGIVVLADGMGGYNAGEVASGMTVALIGSGLREALALQAPDQPDLITGRAVAWSMVSAQIRTANHAIFEAASSEPGCAGMGTTLVAGLFFDSRLLLAHVGDSRCYRLRADELTLLTRDHSLLQEQIDAGLVPEHMARFVDYRNLVTRAVGVDPDVDADLAEYPAQVGDIYLFCSDGLNDMIEDNEIGDVLRSFGADLTACATALIQTANGYGGRDNISVVLVRIAREYDTPAQSWLPKLFSWFGSSH